MAPRLSRQRSSKNGKEESSFSLSLSRFHTRDRKMKMEGLFDRTRAEETQERRKESCRKIDKNRKRQRHYLLGCDISLSFLLPSFFRSFSRTRPLDDFLFLALPCKENRVTICGICASVYKSLSPYKEVAKVM